VSGFQRVAKASAAHLVEVVVDGLDAAILLEQLCCRFVPDPAHTGHVVAGVTGQSLIVDQLSGLQAITLVDALLVVDDGVAKGAPGCHHPHVGADELEGVGIAGHDEGIYPLAFGLLCQCGQHVVGLVALRRVGGDVKDLKQLVDALELHAQVVGHRRPVGLVLGVLLMAESAAQVKGHSQVVGMLVAQHVEQHGSKAKHGVGQFAVRGRHGGWQREIGAVHQRVPVYQYQLGRLGHLVLLDRVGPIVPRPAKMGNGSGTAAYPTLTRVGFPFSILSPCITTVSQLGWPAW
jgi:hypothetical protein